MVVVLWCIYVKDSDADTLALRHDVERASVYLCEGKRPLITPIPLAQWPSPSFRSLVGCRGSFNGWSEARLFFAQLPHSAFSSAQGFPAAVDIAIERTFSSLRRFGLGRVLSLCRGQFFFAVAVTVCFSPAVSWSHQRGGAPSQSVVSSASMSCIVAGRRRTACH